MWISSIIGEDKIPPGNPGRSDGLIIDLTMLLREYFNAYSLHLQPLYEPREATLIAGMVFEKATGYRRLDLLTRPDAPLTDSQKTRLEAMLVLLLEKRPVQYVLGEAWFCGLAFQVSEAVLIPRPETEELVQWILEDLARYKVEGRVRAAPVILDLGTGSGCIAVSLKSKLPTARVIGLDISREALVVARENARRHQVSVELLEADLLEGGAPAGLPSADIIVSNPPYIPASSRGDMQQQITEYEPSGALFVPDEDPLIFYKAILQMGHALFRETGYIYAEVHEDFSHEVETLFLEAGAGNVTLRSDMQERPRMMRARFGKARAISAE